MIDVFIDQLDISGLGFKVETSATGHPGYHPHTLEMERLKKLEVRMLETPDEQLSLIDPDACSMKCRGAGVVGYNVQTAVDTAHHLIVAHEVTNVGIDRRQLTRVAKLANSLMAPNPEQPLPVIAD